MRYLGLVAAALSLALVGCDREEEGCPDGPQFVTEVAGDRTALFAGCDVRREVRETGTFEPSADQTYVLIEVPDALIPTSKSDPTTISLCDPSWQVRVEFHDAFCPDEPPDPNNPIMVALSSDECVVHGESGQTGLYGRVQVVRQADGHLVAAVEYDADVYYTSERGTTDGMSYSYTTGALTDDPDLEDPILTETCGCSIEEPCERPMPPA
jgi:hypothetical protein